MVELQSWISSCRKFLKTNMGSFLMRSARDEPLLIGKLCGIAALCGQPEMNLFLQAS
jgi:hypothetical protein